MKLVCTLIYAVLNALPFWVIMFQHRKALARATSDNYKPFTRNDIKTWNYGWALVT
jgi:hypothetical protein